VKLLHETARLRGSRSAGIQTLRSRILAQSAASEQRRSTNRAARGGLEMSPKWPGPLWGRRRVIRRLPRAMARSPSTDRLVVVRVSFGARTARLDDRTPAPTSKRRRTFRNSPQSALVRVPPPASAIPDLTSATRSRPRDPWGRWEKP